MASKEMKNPRPGGQGFEERPDTLGRQSANPHQHYTTDERAVQIVAAICDNLTRGSREEQQRYFTTLMARIREHTVALTEEEDRRARGLLAEALGAAWA
jgi:hypothetical protein